MKKFVFSLLLVSAALQSLAQQVGKGLTASNGSFIGFYQYTPANYNNNTSVTYPLIVFLHGMGERGNGTTQLPNVTKNGIPSYIKKGSTMTFTWNGKTETFLVLSPQLSTAYGGWQAFYIDEMIKYAKANLRVDTNRIFLTGFSMGGSGVWSYATNTLVHASYFAGIVPVCAGCAVVNACNIADAKTAVWAFHSTDDSTISVVCTISAINAINDCKPAVIPDMTLYTSGDHFIWDKAYDQTHNRQNPNVYEWMLNQNRGLAVNKDPVVKAGGQADNSSKGKAILNANGSYDPDGSILTFLWRKLSGPSGASISKPSSTDGITNITGLTTAGIYMYELKGIDNRAAWAMDTIMITVDNRGVVIINQSPHANAGKDTTITLPVNSIVLDGSGSSDPENALASFNWTKISGPDQYTIAEPDKVLTTVTNLAEGIYQFRLLVSDTGGLKSDDTIQVTVKPPLVSETAKDTLRVSPNPSSSYINIFFTGFKTGKLIIRIFDANGRMVINSSAQKTTAHFSAIINVSGLRNGPYYVELLTADKKKFVVKMLKR